VRYVLLLAVTVCLTGCNPSGASAPAAPTRPSLRSVALPDMSNSAEPVQAQIRARHAALTSAIEKGNTQPTDLADAYGEMGKLFIAAEYFDAAEGCFSNAQMLVPSEMKWPYYLGHVFRLKSDTARAATAFERALVLRPNDVATLVWLAEMHLANNRVEEAERLLVVAQSLDRDSAAVSYGLGRAALAKQQYPQAVSFLEKALTAAPAATRVQYPLAMAYRGLGNTRAAEAHLKLRGDVDLLPTDPLMADVAGLLQNAAAYETRGSKALESQQWADAAANLSKAVELAPNNAFTRLNLGTAWYMQGDSDRALEQYREAVRLSPGLARAHFGIGVVMESRGRDGDAIGAFSTAVANDPNYLEARFSLANALRRNDRVQESLPHYAEILHSNPAVSQASFGYAMGLVRLARYQEARDRLQASMKAFPDQPGFAHALARLLAAAPDDRVRDGAHANAIMTALLKDQRTLGLAETMAMTQAELGRFPDAIRWQQEAIEMARQSGQNAIVARLNDTLRLYEAGRPCRTPWTNDDPVHHPKPGA
jgi:tetratricopeptide (TPR) repeat protein